jgi:hypothetical protein
LIPQEKIVCWKEYSCVLTNETDFRFFSIDTDSVYVICFWKKVKLLLKEPLVDPCADNDYAIRWASWNGHVEGVKLLLNDPRADLSADRNYAICLASRGGHVDVVKLLLDDPRIDPSGDINRAIR